MGIISQKMRTAGVSLVKNIARGERKDMDAQKMVTVGLLVILGILALIFLAAFCKGFTGT